MRHTTRAIASIAAVAALATGCATTDDINPPESSETAVPEPPADTQPAQPGEEAPVETVTEDLAAEDPAGDPSGDSERAPAAPGGEDDTDATAPENGEECIDLPTDPREQYPDGSAPGRMPKAGANPNDTQYWVENVQNHYDPCAPLSWIVFNGGLGRTDATGGTASSITDGIAFYVHGAPEAGMKTFSKVEGVKANDDGTVEFSWGEANGATVEGITDHFTVTLSAANGSVEPVGGDAEAFNKKWRDTPDNEYLLGHGEAE